MYNEMLEKKFPMPVVPRKNPENDEVRFKVEAYKVYTPEYQPSASLSDVLAAASCCSTFSSASLRMYLLLGVVLTGTAILNVPYTGVSGRLEKIKSLAAVRWTVE